MPNQDIESFASRNRLIAALPPGDRERLLLRCRPVALPNERVLVAPREEVRYAYFPTDGVVALLMVMEARETASTSLPTLNGSRMFLPANWAANSGGSTEK